MDIIRKIYVFVRRKYRVIFKKSIVKKENELLKNTDFVIVADNCWGAAVYQWYERPYNSPFAGIGIYGDCYLKLLLNFDYYMSMSLNFVTDSKYPQRKITYPLALLGDIEIHFTHYKTEEDAGFKWEKRKERMLKVTDKDKYFFKICDAWGANESIFKKFHELPFKNKVSYTLKSNKTFDADAHIGIKEKHEDDKTTVPNGVKLFKISFLYFNLTNWLLTSNIKRTTFKS